MKLVHSYNLHISSFLASGHPLDATPEQNDWGRVLEFLVFLRLFVFSSHALT